MLVLVVLLLLPKNENSVGVVVLEIILSGILMAIIMPVQEYAEFDNRRNLDTWFSLPIDRMKLGLIHYLNGALQIGIVVIFMSVGLLFRTESGTIVYYGMYALFCFTVLILCLLLYGLLCLAFTAANTSSDGCTFIIAYLLLPAVINFARLMAAERFRLKDWAENWRAIGMIGIIFRIRLGFASEIGGFGETEERLSDLFYDSWFVSRTVANILICAAATVIMLYIFRNRHAEKVEDISDSWFGYRMLLPIYAFCAAFISFSYAGSVLLGLVLIICYMGYRRGSKLHKSDWTVIAAYFLLALALCVLEGPLR